MQLCDKCLDKPEKYQINISREMKRERTSFALKCNFWKSLGSPVQQVLERFSSYELNLRLEMLLTLLSSSLLEATTSNWNDDNISWKTK